MKEISAIICTHNGQKMLKPAITSLIDQSLPKTDYEILVVDNCSTDNTKKIAEEFGADCLRYIFEPKLGLSHARNCGWMNAQGKYIAYLDDDAIACPDWLEQMLKVFASIPKVGALGGKVDPMWEIAPPTWINSNMTRFLSVVDWSATPVILDEHQYLIGANICFPKDILEKNGGFSEGLGRKGNSLISNEEIELINKIREGGYAVYYHPKIAVKHFVSSLRLNPSWFRKRWFSQGISDAILFRRAENPSNSKKMLSAIKTSINIFIRPADLLYASLPSRFPKASGNCHQSIVRLGFLYGLFSKLESD